MLTTTSALPLRQRALALAVGLFNRLTLRFRRAYYLDRRGTELVSRLPGPLRRILGLDDESAVGSRLLEIGGGAYAQPGRIHVDLDAHARHLEAVAPAWDLPFPDGWAREVLAIHALEHVHPSQLMATLAEWRRVLAPGGRVRVHVPNTPELLKSLQAAPVEKKWALMGAILGMYCGPEASSPADLRTRSDHQLAFDPELLRWSLEQAGFSGVTDLTAETSDRHTEAWAPLVEHVSLVMEGVR